MAADATECKKSSKDYSGSDDEGVNVLYLASTKRQNKHNNSNDIATGKNPNLLHDTIHHLEKLNVKPSCEKSFTTVHNEVETAGTDAASNLNLALDQVHDSGYKADDLSNVNDGKTDGFIATSRKDGGGTGDVTDSHRHSIKSNPTCPTTVQLQNSTLGVISPTPVEPDEQSVTSLNRKNAHRNQDDSTHKKLPKVNCPEKIIICLDISRAMDMLSFHSSLGDRFSALQLLKRSLRIYLNMKHQLNAHHQFALVILRDTAIWMCDFTCDIFKLMTIIDDLQDTFEAHTCHLSSLFELLSQYVKLPESSAVSLLAPPFVLRVLLFYGRSHCIPTCHLLQHHKALKFSPFFFLDVLYVHEPLSPDNMCERIFEQLCELDANGDCYILEVSHNPTKLHECVSRLLCHPLQRPIQADSCYRLEEMIESR